MHKMFAARMDNITAVAPEKRKGDSNNDILYIILRIEYSPFLTHTYTYNQFIKVYFSIPRRYCLL